MAKINKYQAHKQWRKARGTIDKYIKAGKLSSEKLEDGTVLVDTAELTRVFGEPPTETVRTSIKSKKNSSLRHEIELLKAEIEHKDEKIKDLEEMKTEFRDSRDKYKEDFDRVQRLLEYKTAAPTEEPQAPTGANVVQIQKPSNSDELSAWQMIGNGIGRLFSKSSRNS